MSQRIGFESRRSALKKILAGVSGTFFGLLGSVFSGAGGLARKNDAGKTQDSFRLYGGEFGGIKPMIRRNKNGRL